MKIFRVPEKHFVQHTKVKTKVEKRSRDQKNEHEQSRGMCGNKI